jgi:hypothetical protein
LGGSVLWSLFQRWTLGPIKIDLFLMVSLGCTVWLTATAACRVDLARIVALATRQTLNPNISKGRNPSAQSKRTFLVDHHPNFAQLVLLVSRTNFNTPFHPFKQKLTCIWKPAHNTLTVSRAYISPLFFFSINIIITNGHADF